MGDYFDSIFSRIIVKMLQIPSHGQKVVNSIVEAVKIDKQNKIFVQLLWGQNSLTARPEYRGLKGRLQRADCLGWLT